MALYLSEADVRELLPMVECIDVLETAFARLGAGHGTNVPRSRIRLPNGFLHLMAAADIGPELAGFGYKAYSSTFPGGSCKFLFMLYHGDTGDLLAVMDAGTLGQVRTGAASGLATRHMAPAGASTVGIIGTGYQARAQLEAVCAVRDISVVKAYGRNQERLEAFAQRMGQRLDVEVAPAGSAEECVSGAGIAITITSAREPVLQGQWLKEGAHINAAGGNHWMRREIDDTAVERAGLIVVDDLEQARVECGDLIWPAERGVFPVGHGPRPGCPGVRPGAPSAPGWGADPLRVPGRGHAIEDVAAGLHVYRKARENGVGQELPF